MTNGWIATALIAAFALIAVWQFYLFAAFKNSQGIFDAGGGTIHLWLALGATAVACVAGGLTFVFFLGSEDAGSGLRNARGGLPRLTNVAG